MTRRGVVDLAPRATRWWGAVTALLAGLGVAGCGCGKESGDPIPYLDGVTNGDQYESGPAAGTWLQFPGGRRYRLVHDLGRVPTEVMAYLSFEETSPHDFTTAAGNSALFREVNDAYLDVENGACPDFYLRVVASAPAGP